MGDLITSKSAGIRAGLLVSAAIAVVMVHLVFARTAAKRPGLARVTTKLRTDCQSKLANLIFKPDPRACPPGLHNLLRLYYLACPT